MTNLKMLIQEAKVEKKKKTNVQDNIIGERDLLSAQLFKR